MRARSPSTPRLGSRSRGCAVIITAGATGRCAQPYSWRACSARTSTEGVGSLIGTAGLLGEARPRFARQGPLSPREGGSRVCLMAIAGAIPQTNLGYSFLSVGAEAHTVLGSGIRPLRVLWALNKQ